jgi:hypothetical protein
MTGRLTSCKIRTNHSLSTHAVAAVDSVDAVAVNREVRRSRLCLRSRRTIRLAGRVMLGSTLYEVNTVPEPENDWDCHNIARAAITAQAVRLAVRRGMCTDALILLYTFWTFCR